MNHPYAYRRDVPMDVLAAFNASSPEPITEQHHTGLALHALRKQLIAAGFDCSPIAWDHGQGRHRLTITAVPENFSGSVEL